MNCLLSGLFYVLPLFGFSQLSYALDSDADQPATLDADDMEIDFATGVRTYRGNVVFSQGSILMNCEELVTYLNEADSLDKAICVGRPARFKQRPQGHDTDITGRALEITMDQVNDLVTLKHRAKVEQGTSTITGRTITYNLATEKATVKGGGSQSAVQSGGAETTKQADSAAPEDRVQDDNARPSLVIQPRKKKSEISEQTGGEETQ